MGGLSRRPTGASRVPYRWKRKPETEGQSQGRGGAVSGLQTCRWPPKAGTGEKRGSSLEPSEGMQTCWHLDINSVRPLQSSDLQNYRRIHLSYFKPLSSWRFVIVAIGQWSTWPLHFPSFWSSPNNVIISGVVTHPCLVFTGSTFYSPALAPSLALFSASPIPYKLLLKGNLFSNCQLTHGEKFAGRNVNIFWFANYYQYIRVLYLGVFNLLILVAPVKPSWLQKINR